MSGERPNIVLIMCDQMRYDCAGFAGHPVARTPTLDRLASEGVQFENTYCGSPVCSPARASWLTGLYPHGHLQLRNYAPQLRGRWGCHLPSDTVTIGDELANAGYLCGIVGPWHLGDDEQPQHGFDAMWETYRYHREGAKTDPYHRYLAEHGASHELNAQLGFVKGIHSGVPSIGATLLPTEHQRTSWTVSRGIELLRQQPSPFFLFLSVKDPHPPMYPPAEFLPPYPFQDMPVSPTWDEAHTDKPGFLARDYRTCAQRFGYENLQRITAHYLALISHIDNQLDRLFSVLDELGQSDNTIVAFISDHGEMLGDHGMFTKGVMYEASVRVPCLIRWPRALPAGGKVSTPLAGVDLMPTLLELAGVPLSTPVHGRSVAEAVLSGGEPEERPVLSEIPTLDALHKGGQDRDALAATVMIRWQGWKYIRHRYDIDELYDLDADPNETTNLIDHPDWGVGIAEMQSQLAGALGSDAGPYAWCLD